MLQREQDVHCSESDLRAGICAHLVITLLGNLSIYVSTIVATVLYACMRTRQGLRCSWRHFCPGVSVYIFVMQMSAGGVSASADILVRAHAMACVWRGSMMHGNINAHAVTNANLSLQWYLRSFDALAYPSAKVSTSLPHPILTCAVPRSLISREFLRRPRGVGAHGAVRIGASLRALQTGVPI